MPAVLTTAAVEESTFAVTATFTDEDGAPLTPTALTWTLTDLHGTVINGRLEQAITPASSVTVVLSGLDLALPDPSDNRRVMLFEGTYNSSLGSNLSLKDQVEFPIVDLAAES